MRFAVLLNVVPTHSEMLGKDPEAQAGGTDEFSRDALVKLQAARPGLQLHLQHQNNVWSRRNAASAIS